MTISSVLDTVLSITIPLLAFGVLGLAVYNAFQKPIHDLINWIRSFFVEEPDYRFRNQGLGLPQGEIAYR